MGKIRLGVGFSLLVICIHLLTIEVKSNREDLIQDSVRRLLGVKSVAIGKNTTLPPQYLMDLYEKYRSGQTPIQGNTVRSILPFRDPMGDGEVLIFNLTSIHSSEQILQSKLYLLKRRRAKSAKKRHLSNFRIKIGTLPHMTSHHFINISLTNQKSEWHAYDITESVALCRQLKEQDHLLGVSLEILTPRGLYRLVPFRRLLKRNSQPFVLVFSEDNTNQTRRLTKTKPKGSRTKISDLLTAKVDTDNLPLDGQLRTKRSLLSNRSYGTRFKKNYYMPFRNIKLSNDTFSYKTKNYFSNSTKWVHLRDSSKFLSQKFSFKTLNEVKNSLSEGLLKDVLPEVLFKNVHTIPWSLGVFRTNGTKQTSIYKKLRLSKRSVLTSISETATSKEQNSVAKTFQKEFSSERIPLKRRRNKRRNGKKRKKKRRKGNRKLPFWWTRHDGNLHSRDLLKTCQRKSLVVDFEKLGWGDWIMSPKSFNAYYCSGGCSFPLIKGAHPSNHAAIQSLVHVMRLSPNVPTPCCVPSETKPLTLLYFDEHNSLVLKNYPNMIVEKCACR